MSYQDVKDRLYHGHKRIANSTYLELLSKETVGGVEFPEYIVMGLHNYIIARFYPDYLQLYSAGRYIPTTKDRLNLALSIAGISGYSVWQHRRTWYYGYLLSGKEFYDGMKIDYTGRVYT